jgi:flagellar biosynthetic protein FliP
MRPKLFGILGVLLLAGLCFLPHEALAQKMTIDLGDNSDTTSAGRLIQLVVLMTVISLAPSILVMMTSFVRMVVVFSFLRSAMGLQQTPPNQALISLALFLTAFVMAPVFETAYEDGLRPLIDNEINEEMALERTAAPFHTFMLKQVREKDLQLFMDMVPDLKVEAAEDTPYRVLIPGFMISELRRAFEIGFLLFIPFVIIDLLVASILMAMGMMMLPPVVISLPFKLIFFVMVDGWYMICGSLVRSFH